MTAQGVPSQATNARQALPLVAVVMDDDCLLDSTQMLLSTAGIRSAPYASIDAFCAAVRPKAYDAVICSLDDCPTSAQLYEGLRRVDAGVPLIVMYQSAKTKLLLAPRESDGLTLVETPCGPDDLMDNLVPLLKREYATPKATVL